MMTHHTYRGGGTAATAGFRYQFLRTAQEVLDLYGHDPEGTWLIHVESDADDSVDYQVHQEAGQPPTLTAQVKSSLPAAGTVLGRAEATRILASLASRHLGDIALVVHRNLSAGARLLRETLQSSGEVDGIDPADRGRVRIDHDPRSTADVQKALGSRIRRIRTRATLPVSERVVGMITASIVDLVFKKASTPGDHTLSSSDLHSLLRVAGVELAQAAGHNPHWTPLGVPPSFATSLPRHEVSVHLDGVLDLVSLETGHVRLAAVTGAPGMGKSSAATAWLRQRHDRYTVTLWADASDPGVLHEQVRSLLVNYGDLTISETSEIPVSDLFKQFLEALAFPWLLVIDGATSAAQVKDWIPTHGFGHVVVTTTDATWPAALGASTEVTEMDDDTGLALVCATLERRRDDLSTDELHAARALLSAMGGWPIALMMAATWIRDSRGGLANVGLYLEDLEKVDLGDEAYQPFGYPRTAASAIVQAVDGFLTTGDAVLTPDRLLAATAHLGAHQVPTLIAALLAQGNPSDDVDHVAVDHAVQVLRQRALIERNQSAPTLDPRFADRLSMHSVIARVVRARVRPETSVDLAEGAAYLLLEYLGSGFQAGDIPFALSLVPAVSNVVRDVPKLADNPERSGGAASPLLLVLAGSLAKVLAVDGRYQEAYDLLRAEIALLPTTSPTWQGADVDQVERAKNLLIAHIDILSISQSLGNHATFVRELESLVDAIETTEVSEAGATVLLQACDGALQAVDSARLDIERTRSLAGRVSRIRTLAVAVAPDATESAHRLLHQAEEMIGRDPRLALDLASQALSAARHSVEQVPAMLLVAECLACSGRPEDAEQAAMEALAFAAANGLKQSTYADSLLEIANGLALPLVLSPTSDIDDRSMPVLGRILELAAAEREIFNSRSRARLDTYMCVHATLASADSGEVLTHKARASLREAHETGSMITKQYNLFTNLITEAGLRAAGAEPSRLRSDAVAFITDNPAADVTSIVFDLTQAGPAIVFHHPTPATASNGSGTRNLAEASLHEAGLPASHPAGDIPTINHWRALASRGLFRVLDTSGARHFEHALTNVPAEWLAAVRTAGFVWFVYGGRTALETTQITEGTYERSNAYIKFSRSRFLR